MTVEIKRLASLGNEEETGRETDSKYVCGCGVCVCWWVKDG